MKPSCSFCPFFFFCWLSSLREEARELDAEELRYPFDERRCTRYFVRARPRRQAACELPDQHHEQRPLPTEALILPPSGGIYIDPARYPRFPSLTFPPRAPSISATLILSLFLDFFARLHFSLADLQGPPTCTYTKPTGAPSSLYTGHAQRPNARTPRLIIRSNTDP